MLEIADRLLDESGTAVMVGSPIDEAEAAKALEGLQLMGRMFDDELEQFM